MAALNAWRLPEPRPRARAWPPALKWGMAALFALGFGFGMGWFSAPAADPAAIQAQMQHWARTALAQEIRAQVRKELEAEFQTRLASSEQRVSDKAAEQIESSWNAITGQAAAVAAGHAQNLFADFAEKHQTERALIWGALRNLDARQTRQGVDLVSLRRDAETVAVLTQESFRRAEDQLVRLAHHAEPAPDWAEPKDQPINPQ